MAKQTTEEEDGDSSGWDNGSIQEVLCFCHLCSHFVQKGSSFDISHWKPDTSFATTLRSFHSGFSYCVLAAAVKCRYYV